MRFFYSLLFYLLLPFILIRLLWKSRRASSYRKRISERLMWFNPKPQKVDVWIHAVSLGEVNAALGLAEECLTKGWKLLITTMTPTGSERVQTYFGSRVLHQYIPYDLPSSLRRFYKIYSPKVGIIIETELWPNLIAEAYKANVPLFLVNARISPNTFKSYMRIRWFLRPYLNMFTGILTQSLEETARFIQLGAKEILVEAIGNLKFDIKPYMGSVPQFTANRLIICAASTHEGEEQQILKSFREFKAIFPQALLILAPRHPERFQKVFNLCIKESYRTNFSDDIKDDFLDADIIVVNAIGKLMDFYSCSNYAFVGGSLVSKGGHNVLEAVCAGIPVFSGPHVSNFKVIVNSLLKSGGIQIIRDANELFLAINKMQKKPELKFQQVSAATKVLQTHQGAVRRCMEKLANSLDSGAL